MSNVINLQYWKKQIDRWHKTPFILGYEVKLSDNPEQICTQLAGVYPKWFLFTGWAKGCNCLISPILPSNKEYNQYKTYMLTGNHSLIKFTNMVMDVPENFKQWLKDNQELIDKPDFVKANFVNGDIKQGLAYPGDSTLLTN